MIHSESQAADPASNLSNAELFRLQTATYLSLVQALDQAGVIDVVDIASLLETHVGPDDRAPWADVARAFVDVLRGGHVEDAPETEPRPSYRRFQVIEGGRRN